MGSKPISSLPKPVWRTIFRKFGSISICKLAIDARFKGGRRSHFLLLFLLAFVQSQPVQHRLYALQGGLRRVVKLGTDDGPVHRQGQRLRVLDAGVGGGQQVCDAPDHVRLVALRQFAHRGQAVAQLAHAVDERTAAKRGLCKPFTANVGTSACGVLPWRLSASSNQAIHSW